MFRRGIGAQGPSWLGVILESIKSANRHPWRTAAVAAVVFAMSVAVLLTYGQTVAIQNRVQAELESPAARLITVSWRRVSGGIDSSAVERLANLSHVEWVVGMGPATDIRNTLILGGRSCPSKVVVGQLPGETIPIFEFGSTFALATSNSERCLGLVYPAGTISPATAQQSIIKSDVVPVIGQVQLGEALSIVRNFTFIWQSVETPLAEIFVLVEHAQDIEAVTRAAMTLVGTDNPTDIAIDSSVERMNLFSALENELATNSQVIALSVLGAGLAVIGLTLTLSVGAQRRDFGRRRALGASRSMLVVLVIMEAAIPAILGAVMGTAVGIGSLLLIHNISPSISFIVSVPILSIIATVAGSIPAALTAAFRDPVATVRVP